MRLRTKILSGLLAVAMAVPCCNIMTYAANVKEIPSTEVESVYEGAVASNSWEGWPSGPKIYSEAGIVMDMDSGIILYAKNIDDQHYPASITKIMTALVALEHYEMNEPVTFTWDDIGFLEYGDAHIGIKPDEKLSMEDCMYGMLLASANEVSHAIGAHMEGGYDEFIRVMNEKAKEIGCTNSNWVNTYGLHDPEHYTSVKDMALIGSAVFKYEKFREIVNSKTHVIGETNITDESRPFRQNHKMIHQDHQYYYEYCVGGKTGYTDQALTTLVTFATKDDMNLVAVVMRTHGGGKNAYVDTRAMLDYSFDNFSKLSVNNEMFGDKSIVEVKENAYVMLPTGVEFQQLESYFTETAGLNPNAGVITYTYNGNEVGKIEVEMISMAPEEVDEAETMSGMKLENGLKVSSTTQSILIILVITVVLYCILLGYIKRKREQKRRRNRQRRFKQ